MAYFLRNFCISTPSSSEASTPSGSPKHHGKGSPKYPIDLTDREVIPGQLAQLLRHCLQASNKNHILRLPIVRKNPSQVSQHHEDDDFAVHHRIFVPPAQSKEADQGSEIASSDILSCLKVIAAPTSFGVATIARTIVFRYLPLLKLTLGSCHPLNQFQDEVIGTAKTEISELQNEKVSGGNNQIVILGLRCLFSVLGELNNRDPELCSDALSSVLQLVQYMAPEALCNEAYSSVKCMHDLLRQLRVQGAADVSSKATSCMIGLAVAYGIPEFLLTSVASLLCDEVNGDSKLYGPALISIPENQHRLASLVQRMLYSTTEIPSSTSNWWSHCLTRHVVVCSFDLHIPNDLSPGTLEDCRLAGALASDGAYLYILTCFGLFKYGTGMAETISNKLYASNTCLKASQGCWLTICSGSLYLRRRQSSRMWVIDVDTLREIGEIMLHTSSIVGALTADDSSFYQIDIDEQWNCVVVPLDDSFSPIKDSKSRKKYRLAEMGYAAVGEFLDVPHGLPFSLPKHLQAQAADMQVGREIAVLLARNGKVYYSGSGLRFGLQDAKNAWMELVLPEAVVSVAIGTDTESIVLRSGSGHIYVACVGPETLNQGSPAAGRLQKQEFGSSAVKLWKLPVVNRRKCVSVTTSAGCVAYVTDAGKAYIYGRHMMRCDSDTGQILGLEGVHVASLCLGKTHAVAISRHGNIYTWGLNNLNQCGRTEVSGYLPSGVLHDEFSHAVQKDVDDEAKSAEFCPPNEHLWVKDVASICVKCGRCSAGRARCNSSRMSHDPQQRRKGAPCICGEGESCCLRCGLCRACGEDGIDETLQGDGEWLGTPQRAMLPPAKLLLHKSLPDIKVSAVSCGNYHTIVLGADRQIFTFGSNCHGQLGVGHTNRCMGPQKVNLPPGTQVVQIAAGSNHSVLRTADGSVLTFGAYRQGQLGREGEDVNWHASPDFIPGYGRGCGTVATWIGVSGDTTLIHSQKQIFGSDVLSNSQIVSNKDCILIFPNQVGKEYVAIQKSNGEFYQHSLGPAGLYISWCLEPKYNLVWTFNAAEMRVQAFCDSVSQETEGVISNRGSLTRTDSMMKEISFLRAPEFAIPTQNDIQLSPHQMALSVLATTYAATMLATVITAEGKGSDADKNIQNYTSGLHGCSENFMVVNRFAGFGGGWGYSAHSLEAIQFRVNRDIHLHGVGLFGGRGEYIAKLKLYRQISAELDDQNAEVVCQTDEMLFECGLKERAHLMFPEPVAIAANHWHTICAQINGPSSDCGAGGRPCVHGDDGVQFNFRSSRLSNNGTDVNVGQIPEFLYVVDNQAGPSATVQNKECFDTVESYCPASLSKIMRMQTLLLITPSSIRSLFRILHWAVEHVFTSDDRRKVESTWMHERSAMIAILSLKLLCYYVRCIYFGSTENGETDIREPSVEFAELIVKFSSAVNAVFDLANEKVLDEDPSQRAVINEAVETYVACSKVFLPSPQATLERLAVLMSTPNRDWSLVALLDTLCEQDYLLPILLSYDYGNSSSCRFPELQKLFLKNLQTRTSTEQQKFTSMQAILRFLFEIAFSQQNNDPQSNEARLKRAACKLIIVIAQELVTSRHTNADGPPILQTASRFRRHLGQASWDVSSGASDAISIRFDCSGISLHGAGIYCGPPGQQYNFTCEVFINNGDAAHEQWHLLEKVGGTLGASPVDDIQHETCLVRLGKPVLVQPGRIYAIRLNVHGGRTACGEGGVSSLRLCNGTRVHFQPCSLSENGTSLARGQIPFLLYSINESVHENISTTDQEQLTKWFLILLRMLSFKISNRIAAGIIDSSDRALCSTICGFVVVFLTSNPRKALDIVATLDELIPMIASANSENLVVEKQKSFISRSHTFDSPKTERMVVESPHPYVPCNIHSQVVGFHKSVQYMSLLFNDDCRTAQVDDVLWVYVEVNRECYVPVGRFYGNRNWPEQMLLVPGNSLWFILETSPGSNEPNEIEMYGYRCTVTGYTTFDSDSDLALEQELTWICASACRLLIQIPSAPSILNTISIAEEEVHEVIRKHGNLLRKGLSLSHIPTANEILRKGLPSTPLTPDLKFLKEFIVGSSSTSAGFLARWFTCESVVDIHCTQLYMPDEDMRVGVATQISCIPRDQYGRLALCQTMKVEITVRSGESTSGHSSSNSGPLQPRNDHVQNINVLPTLQQLINEPYRPVYISKARYTAITMMPSYVNYSFEELRFAYLKDAVLKETIAITQKSDGSFGGEWIPKQRGTFRIECRIDGFQLAQSYIVEVCDDSNFKILEQRQRDPQSKGSKKRVAYLSRARFAVCDRKVVSRGVRIRATPSLNALQIGVIQKGCTVTYLEEVETVDGIWLRLTDETCALHCTVQFPTQAWCLQYSKHLGREFLTILSSDIEDMEGRHEFGMFSVNPDSVSKTPDRVSALSSEASEGSVGMNTDETYIIDPGAVINLYDYPSLDSVTSSTIDGSVEREVRTDTWLYTREGVWIRLAGRHNRYILAQDSLGRCNVHRKGSTVRICSNGNNGETSSECRPVAHVSPSSRVELPIRSLRPSIADCCRTVFAAFLWHEKLVKDAMACATYLKFHPELHRFTYDRDRLSTIAKTPLQPLAQLWHEINSAVQASIERHLILPSPPPIRQFSLRPISANLGSSHQSQVSSSHKEELCELCEQWHSAPITTHMRMAHRGCGQSSNGHGYNSAGKYTTGWVGNCGEGGRPNAAWYLMCPTCRSEHLKQTPSGHQQEKNRRWREFRVSAAAADFNPDVVIRQNALFLLELNPSIDDDIKEPSAQTGWTVNLFPQSETLASLHRSVYTQTGNGLIQSSANKVNRSFIRTFSHASDPGPKPATGKSFGLYDSGLSKNIPMSAPVTVMTAASDISDTVRKRRFDQRDHRLSDELIQSPSSALRSIVNSYRMSDNGERPEIANSGSLNGILRRPVLSFVTERHNLAHIRSAMSTAVARAVFFSHSFRVWNWLLKIVSVESSISDIIWQYLTALTSYAPLARWYTEDVTLATRLRLLPHPWRVCFIAGPVASRMVVQMHSFLHTVSVILKSGAVDPALRCLCFRAWTLQLTYHEQDMLSLICSVLSTVGRVLSDQSGEVSLQLDGSTPKSDTDLGDLAESESSSPSPVLKELVDLSNTLRIEATSRQAMVVCLTDGSGETFWESGEEDKNRSRSLTVHLQNESVSASLLALYIDNIRDEGHRITSVTVTTVDVNGAVKKLHSDALGYQFIGWTKCCLIGVSSVRVILKGPDQSSRLRQLRVFGFKAENDVLDDMEKREQISLRPSASHQLLFNYTQLDAFGLFQSIAAQAFGDEFSHEENGTLRQQILELLFSRVQLQSLQTYICSQMVNALEREVTNLRMKAKRNYSYACGLMVMLTKICGSRHGTDVFSVRNNLLLTLSELLLFAPQAVQFQAFETTERLIGLFSPSFVDCSKFIENLLVIIAKVISLQIRDKANHTVMTATLAVEVDDAPEYWRIDRLPTMDVGMLTKQFLSRLGDNCVDEKWMVVLRKEVAFHVMNLCQMNASDSLSSDRISTPNSASPLQSHLSSSRYTILKSKKFWLSVAALSILSDSFWLELSPIWQNMQDKKCNEPEHFCDNHDDGRTIAQVYCDVCECYLCHECFTVLHLNKRNRSHAVQLLGVSGKCPQIDIHEGCTRFRLSNLLILFHGSSLNGMVELTSNNSREFFLSSHSLKEEVSSVPSHTDQLLRRTSVHCRFCGNLLKQREQVHSGVCEHEECTRLAYFACSKVLLCGHPCCGIRNETDCLPCIICNNREVRQDADDLCVICFTDRLGGSPCIQLECGHIFHYLCVKAALEKKWIGPRILFRFMQCPLCRKQIEHPSLKELLEPMKALQADVASKARLRLEYDGLLQCPAITSENSEFHDDPEAYAMDRYVYVLCHKCGKPYFGGESRCQQALDSSQYNPEELLCGGCSNVSGSQVCGRHGVDYLEYKCRFCCSVAVYFCFGTSHFCAACHDDFQRLMCLPKQLLPKCPAGPRGIQLDGDCPLRVDHPATGEEFALGCGICRNLNTF